MFNNLIDKLKDELKEYDKVVSSGQELSTDDYDCIDVMSHSLKSLVTVNAMEEPSYDDGYGRGYDWSGKRYRSMRRSRDYGYRNDDEVIEKLQDAYDEAQSEQERKTIRKMIEMIK